ncbi:hypothetical protein MYX64_07000 [Nitrospinae bacterium AH_259_B05_G02_I21]|nr:hypothetical protein [Nitrospinae bacterium AH_259_B05_G02_I21]MDA2932101.1 hypothetical protein [Nitrospinae bacterium AH-259-F20]
MQSDTMKRTSSISISGVRFLLSGVIWVSFGVYVMFLGTTEAPGLSTLVGLIVGGFSTSYGIYLIFHLVEEAEVSPGYPMEEANTHLGPALFMSDALAMGGPGLECPDIGSPDFCS